MANVLVNETSLVSIGDAIRSKLGVQTTYLPSEMPAAILSIPTGSEDAWKQFTEATYSHAESTTASIIGEYAYKQKLQLITASFPNATYISRDAFQYCRNLTSIYVPSVTSMHQFCFDSCDSLTSISMPNLLSTRGGCFYRLGALTSLSLPNLQSVGEIGTNGDIQNCTSLQRIELPKVTQVARSSFQRCTLLTEVIIGTDNGGVVCQMEYITSPGGLIPFANTPIESGTGYIYVPDNLVNDYKNETGWSIYANQIKGISELPT